MTHWTSTTVAWRLVCKAGKATLTAVPSMKAMLEPRIVAASTHGRDFSAHGADKAPARITASSHGCFILDPDVYGSPADWRSVASYIDNIGERDKIERRRLNRAH